jgi:hypothetical protein
MIPPPAPARPFTRASVIAEKSLDEENRNSLLKITLSFYSATK